LFDSFTVNANVTWTWTACSLQVDGLLEAFCEDAKITVDEAVQGISRLNKITDLHEMFRVSR